jgi:hypothetical protein
MTELKTGKLYLHGTDKEGHPLLVFQTSANVATVRDLEEAGRLIRYMTELVISRMPSNKSKYTILIDRTNHTHANTDTELTKYLSKALQDNFPERLHTCILYPSDFIFYSAWSVVKWFLDPVTRAKVSPCMRFSGVTYYIDPVFIPAQMGGESKYQFSTDDYPEQSFEVVDETGKPWECPPESSSTAADATTEDA